MSVDYQVPVPICGVTVVSGDILVGERHGVLVIPAAIVNKVLEKALAHDQQEEFQRILRVHLWRLSKDERSQSKEV
jgi:regulator of RNase E activity RraA